MKDIIKAPKARTAKAPSEEDRSSAILAAAFQVFAHSGYAAARMEEIASLAGVTKGLIYFYYENKEALFKAVILNHLVQNIHNKLDLLEINPSRSMASHLMQSLALISSLLDERNNPMVPGIFRLLLTEGQRFAELHRFHYHDVMQPIMKRFHHILDEGARRGEWQAERVPAFIQIVIAPLVARTIWNIVFGECEQLDAQTYLKSYQICLLNMLGVDPAQVELHPPLPFLPGNVAQKAAPPALDQEQAEQPEAVLYRVKKRRASLLRHKRNIGS